MAQIYKIKMEDLANTEISKAIKSLIRGEIKMDTLILMEIKYLMKFIDLESELGIDEEMIKEVEEKITEVNWNLITIPDIKEITKLFFMANDSNPIVVDLVAEYSAYNEKKKFSDEEKILEYENEWIRIIKKKKVDEEEDEIEEFEFDTDMEFHDRIPERVEFKHSYIF